MMKNRERAAWALLGLSLAGWYFTAYKLAWSRSLVTVYEEGMKVKAAWVMDAFEQEEPEPLYLSALVGGIEHGAHE